MLTLSGCAKTMGLSGDRVACSAFEPITWEDADTDETIAGVKAHNAVYKELC